MPENLYETLGVDHDASQAEIKKAYRDKAKHEHPDRGGDPEKFHALVRAYDTLGDDQARFEYDATGDVKGDRPDNDRSMALSMIDEMVDQVVQSDDGLYENIIEVFRRTVEQRIVDIQRMVVKAEKNRVRCDKMLKRLKGDGPVRDMFEKRKSKFKAQVKSLETKKRQAGIAMDILKEWDFEPENRDGSSLYMRSPFSSTTTTSF